MERPFRWFISTCIMIPKNILGHAILENRTDGVYAYCSLNDTESGKTAKALVQHGDITALSIYANSLVEKSKNVIQESYARFHLSSQGQIQKHISIILPLSMADGSIMSDETEAIICAGILSHDALDLEGAEEEEEEEDVLEHADDKSKETVGEVFDTLNEKQKTVVLAMIAHALEASEDEEDTTPPVKHSNNEKGESTMKRKHF